MLVPYWSNLISMIYIDVAMCINEVVAVELAGGDCRAIGRRWSRSFAAVGMFCRVRTRSLVTQRELRHARQRRARSPAGQGRVEFVGHSYALRKLRG